MLHILRAGCTFRRTLSLCETTLHYKLPSFVESLRKMHILHCTNIFLPYKHCNFGRITCRFSSTLKKPSTSELKKLISIAKSEKWRITGAIMFLFISSAVTISVPFLVGKFIDAMEMSNSELKENLNSFCMLLIGAFIIGALANSCRVYLMNISSHRVINSLRKKAYASILCQETSFFDKSNTGELINRLSSDATTVGMSITNNISDGLRNAFTFIGASCLMVYTSPSLASLGLAVVAPVAFIAVTYSKILKQNSKGVQDALAEATQVSEERISNIRTVQTFARLDREIKFYSSKIDNVMCFVRKESLGRAKFFGMTGLSGNLIILVVLYKGGMLLSENAITVGSLSAFLLYSAYVGISIGGLSNFYSELMRGLGASTRIWELINRKPLISTNGGITIPNFEGNVVFDNINFSYPTRPDVPVLSDFSLSIPSGSVYALVGSSGCGKSTIGSLLLRLYDCQSGSVMVDGHNVKAVNANWLRRNIGVVSQDPILFSHSIRDNVLYGSGDEGDVTEARLLDVLQKANALEFVKQFPQGLDTLVGERGVMLSGGQKQRIAIARAILKNPRVLILDEATSALDAESEYLVHSALEDLMQGRTVLMIAHRLSTVRRADIIVFLENGRVVQKGKFDELLSNKGPFYRLVQFQGLKP